MIHFVGSAPLIESTYKSVSVDHVKSYFKDANSIAVDTETKGRNPHTKRVLSLQLGDPDNQFVIDCRTIDIREFKDLLENKLVLLHNAKFDYKFLFHNGIILDKIWDTMLAECVLFCGYESYGYSLANVLKRYLDIELSKDTRGDFFKIEDEPFTDKQIEYAALDVKYLHPVAKLQHAALNKYGLSHAANVEFEVTKSFADIEYNGVYLDGEAWKSNYLEFKDNLAESVFKLDEFVITNPKLDYPISTFGEDLFNNKIRKLEINYASPKQVLLLLSKLGIDLPNTSNKELVKLSRAHPIIPLILDFRKSAKAVSTYGEKFLDNIDKVTGRVHTDFWQVLNTYRVSSNNPNLQNIPATNPFRNCFLPREGYSWVSIDYSSQELRLMADFSGEDGFIDALNRGEDLHCYAGSMMFKRTITKEDKELRTKAKTINFGKP